MRTGDPTTVGRRENKVETHLTEEVQKIGGDTRKWVCPGRDGVTDRIVLIKGYICLVEVKTVDGKLEPSQEREIPRLIKLGADVYEVYGRKGVDLFINHLKGVIHERGYNTENGARMVFKS